MMIFMKNYNIIYQKRKTLTMKLLEDNTVEVKAPLGIDTKYIENFINKNKEWLDRQQILLENRIKLNSGEQIFVDGNLVTLNIMRMTKDKVLLNETTMHIMTRKLDRDYVINLLFNWFKIQTNKLIRLSISKYESKIDKKIGNIRIKNQKSIWGSCSSKGNLNFSLRCGMMPEFVRDYIVVHELCHLIHMNHSKEFWRQVELVYGDYKIPQNWLKENHQKINF